MEKNDYTSVDIRAIFRLDDRYKSIQTLYNAEERGEIPKAERVSRGKVQVRNWKQNQLPAIGRRFGFLSSPKNKL